MRCKMSCSQADHMRCGNTLKYLDDVQLILELGVNPKKAVIFWYPNMSILRCPLMTGTPIWDLIPVPYCRIITVQNSCAIATVANDQNGKKHLPVQEPP